MEVAHDYFSAQRTRDPRAGLRRPRGTGQVCGDRGAGVRRMARGTRWGHRRIWEGAPAGRPPHPRRLREPPPPGSAETSAPPYSLESQAAPRTAGRTSEKQSERARRESGSQDAGSAGTFSSPPVGVASGWPAPTPPRPAPPRLAAPRCAAPRLADSRTGPEGGRGELLAAGLRGKDRETKAESRLFLLLPARPASSHVAGQLPPTLLLSLATGARSF